MNSYTPEEGRYNLCIADTYNMIYRNYIAKKHQKNLDINLNSCWDMFEK